MCYTQAFPKFPLRLQNSILLRDTIVTWKATRKIFGLPFLMSKHVPESSYVDNIPQNKKLQDKGVHVTKHIMHPEDKRGLSPMEIEKSSLPGT